MSRKTPHVQLVRDRIRTGMLINRLQNHVAGRLPMSRTQIQAAGILLRKTLPDMIAASVETRPMESMNDEELLSTLAAIRSHLGYAANGNRAEDEAEPAPAITLQTLQ